MAFTDTNNISNNTFKGLPQEQQSSYESDLLESLKQQGSRASMNAWADYWYYMIGVNVIPADTQNKRTYESWSEWQNKSIPEEVHCEWKDKNRYSNGIALIPGKVWRGPNHGKFLVFIDADNQKAIDEICTSFKCSNLEYLANSVIVEQHSDNKTRSHLYFYANHIFTKKASDAVKKKESILNNEIPAIEVKGLGEHGIAYCSPSLHKDGQQYEIFGTMTPETYGKEVEARLFQIYNHYGLGTNNEGKVPIKELLQSGSVIHEGHNRHEALLRVMESLIRRKRDMLSLDKIKNIAIEWNGQHCKPPLDEKEVEKQWIDALDFINKQDSNQQQVVTKSETDNLITKQINVEPPVYYYADPISKKIGLYKIDTKKDEKTGEIKEKKNFSNIIIDAIPKEIFIYKDNPLLQKSLQKTKIIFESLNGENYEIGPYDSNDLIIKELENRYLILNKKNADEALSCIINAYKGNNMVDYLDGLTTGGYYLFNNNIKLVGNLQNITNDINKDDIKQTINFLEYLATNGWKNKNIFPTILKWGVVAPFSFIIKSNSNRWMPWLELFGCSQTGKSTIGRLILHMWNLDDRVKSITFSNMDSIPRFGHEISKDTYPTLVNEVGVLSENKNGRYTAINETIKYSIEGIVCRGKFSEGKFYQEILALSPMIFTLNHPQPSDGARNRRFISIHFTEEEKKEPDKQKEFEIQFERARNSLAVLGDFAASCIRDNPSVLLNKEWNDIAIEILEKFYKLVDTQAQAPDWIYLLEEQRDAIEESSNNTMLELRAFLIDKINNAYSRLGKYQDMELDIISKLDYCTDKNLIPFLSRPNDNTLMITKDIMSDIKLNRNIENITGLDSLGLLIGFEYVSKYVNKKKVRVLWGNRIDFIDFISPPVKESDLVSGAPIAEKNLENFILKPVVNNDILK